MKSKTVKTVSIFFNGSNKAKWIFDVSDKTAEKIREDYESASSFLTIESVPTKTATMMLIIDKKKIDYVTIE